MAGVSKLELIFSTINYWASIKWQIFYNSIKTILLKNFLLFDKHFQQSSLLYSPFLFVPYYQMFQFY